MIRSVGSQYQWVLDPVGSDVQIEEWVPPHCFDYLWLSGGRDNWAPSRSFLVSYSIPISNMPFPFTHWFHHLRKNTEPFCCFPFMRSHYDSLHEVRPSCADWLVTHWNNVYIGANIRASNILLYLSWTQVLVSFNVAYKARRRRQSIYCRTSFGDRMMLDLGFNGCEFQMVRLRRQKPYTSTLSRHDATTSRLVFWWSLTFVVGSQWSSLWYPGATVTSAPYAKWKSEKCESSHCYRRLLKRPMISRRSMVTVSQALHIS